MHQVLARIAAEGGAAAAGEGARLIFAGRTLDPRLPLGQSQTRVVLPFCRAPLCIVHAHPSMGAGQSGENDGTVARPGQCHVVADSELHLILRGPPPPPSDPCAQFLRIIHTRQPCVFPVSSMRPRLQADTY